MLDFAGSLTALSWWLEPSWLWSLGFWSLRRSLLVSICRGANVHSFWHRCRRHAMLRYSSRSRRSRRAPSSRPWSWLAEQRR
ncbi:hypothetical protein C8R46DRAFT_487011 [Mycena filopes]|nr:hypothetical protein C8R46DRAFT_487011 [Mycena filopes]